MKLNKFIGISLPMQKIYKKIQKIAKSKASVFITGESGTGKELCAQTVHQLSQRKPFIALNCAAIPYNLLESELFGHVKGAFTGADKARQGTASLADSGTLFLDEVGELDVDLQCKLLRFIQTGTFYSVGSHKLKTVDIRFICATNSNPIAKIKAGSFREDLYYRLNVVSISLPPLRERGEDILLLAQTFLNKYAQEEHKHFKNLTQEAAQILLQYSWPGNVRQLENFIHNLVLLNAGKNITAAMVIDALEEAQVLSTELMQSEKSKSSISPTCCISAIRPLWQVEKEAIMKALKYCQGSVEQAAKMLEIGPATIYRKKQQWKELKEI